MPQRPTIGQAAAQAWRDMSAVFRGMQGPVQAALLINMGIGLVRRVVLPDTSEFASGPLLLEFVVAGVQAFLLTPYLIAVHRFIILNEPGPRYALAPGEHRFQLFFLWSMVLSLMYWLPSFAMSWISKGPAVVFLAGFMTLFMILLIAATIISLRLIILFPAIAVDAPGATWRNAIADTAGNAWRILFISLIAALPIIVTAIVVAVIGASMGMMGGKAPPSLPWLVTAGVVDGVVGVIGVTLAVVIASRLYEQLGNRVNQP
jgi:hypothetical protein